MTTEKAIIRNWSRPGLIALALAGLCVSPSLVLAGYVVVPLKAGYNFLANPLDAGNNALTNIIPSVPIGSRTYVWDVTNQVFLPPATFLGGPGWDRNYELPPGKGFVVYASAPWTNVFVGDVLQGDLTNYVAGSNQFSLLGSKVPVGGPLTTSLLFPPLDGANVHFFRAGSQTFSEDFTCFNGYGWFDPQGGEGTNGPVCWVAESFVVQNPGPATNWVRNFVVQIVAGPAAAGLQIPRLQISGSTVKLQWDDPGGGTYDIQFSPDGSTWTTVAKGQKGSAWKGSLPDSSSGYFQIVNTQGDAR